MARLNRIILAGGMVFGLAGGPALAADLLPPAPSLESEAVAEFGNGWYLRGDIGYVDYNRVRDLPFGPPGTVDLVNEKIEQAPSFGGGIGYQITNLIRADVTIDQRLGAKYTGERADPVFTVRDHADLESTTYLFNAYLDLGNWSGITPYIGAGVGVASNRMTNSVRDFELNGFLVGQSNLPRYTATNFAWALMAGLAADVGDGFKIDVGYRYTHLGDARTRLDGVQAGIRTKDIESHEFRVGARYMIE